MTEALATEAQKSYVSSLMLERDYSTLQTENIASAIDAGLTKAQASMLISLLKDCPKIASQKSVIAEGFYILDGDVYRVVSSKSTGNRYAKILKLEGTKGTWEYAPGAIAKLAVAETLTLEVARTMGAHYGVCMICGRTLTDPESVQAGIGPVCSGKL